MFMWSMGCLPPEKWRQAPHTACLYRCDDLLDHLAPIGGMNASTVR